MTGATGFLGRHVSAALVEAGWAVRALSRRGGSGPELGFEDMPVEIVPGDLTEDSNLASAARGCQAIVHLAGLVNARSLAAYRSVNAAGTDRLVAAAGKTAPEAFFVHVSSQAAAGPARGGRAVAEEDVPEPVSWYGQSKLEGEEAVRRRWPGAWIILRPGPIYGPGDRGLLAYFRLARSGWMPVPAGSSRIQIAHAASIAQALVLAASRPDLTGRTGFLCDPGSLTVRDLAQAIAALEHPPARLLALPDVLVRWTGHAETLREALTGRSRPFNADKAREVLAGDWLCDSAPLRRDLGLPAPIPLERGLRETREWYLQKGWLRL